MPKKSKRPRSYVSVFFELFIFFAIIILLSLIIHLICYFFGKSNIWASLGGGFIIYAIVDITISEICAYRHFNKYYNKNHAH